MEFSKLHVNKHFSGTENYLTWSFIKLKTKKFIGTKNESRILKQNFKI